MPTRLASRHNRRMVLAITILGPPLGAWRTLGGDWPTYRGDDRRSDVSAEALKLPLHEAWVHKAAHPARPHRSPALAAPGILLSAPRK